jgi:hypothetical protein
MTVSLMTPQCIADRNVRKSGSRDAYDHRSRTGRG